MKRSIAKRDTYTVRAGMPYASYVEFGTRKMAANPYMRRGRWLAVKRIARGNVRPRLVKEWEKAKYAKRPAPGWYLD